MNTSSVFVARLQGMPVLDSFGDPVGKVRDVVVQERSGRRAPKCRGLVVELFARKRIFIPMMRVHAIDPTQVAISGTVDTRRFIRREAETLVIEDLFDRVIERPDGTRAVIHDVSFRKVRNMEWELDEVALSEARSGSLRLGRRRHTYTLPWAEVGPAISGSVDQDTRQVLAQMSEMKAADVARELHDMLPDRRLEIAHALDDEQLASALEELPEDEQVSLLQTLDTERAADILEEMDPDDAADLIRELPVEVAEDLLQRMEPEEARDVRNLLVYQESTAGAMMTPEPVILGVDSTVADALARVRLEELTPALASMVFVCRSPLDVPSGRYIGAVHVQRLLREPPSVPVVGMVDGGLEPLSPHQTLAEISRYFATYNLVVAPVVDESQRLIGAITVDDVLDHMLPEDWRGDQMDGTDPDEVSNG